MDASCCGGVSFSACACGAPLGVLSWAEAGIDENATKNKTANTALLAKVRSQRLIERRDIPRDAEEHLRRSGQGNRKAI